MISAVHLRSGRARRWLSQNILGQTVDFRDTGRDRRVHPGIDIALRFAQGQFGQLSLKPGRRQRHLVQPAASGQGQEHLTKNSGRAGIDVAVGQRPFHRPRRDRTRAKASRAAVGRADAGAANAPDDAKTSNPVTSAAARDSVESSMSRSKVSRRSSASPDKYTPAGAETTL